jgi:hypothetical protein
VVDPVAGPVPASGDDLRLGLLEPSESLDNHTAAYCRVAGSFETVPHRPSTVTARIGAKTASVAVDSGDTGEGRFDFYVRMPRWPRHPTLRVTADDGVRSVTAEARLKTPIVTKSRTYRGYTATEAGRRVLGMLRGHGLEFGALHMPAPLDPAVCTVDYADRLTREEAIAQFPQLAAEADQIVVPTLIVDLDGPDLEAVDGSRYDFFVATDVLEHLADPIGFLRRVAGIMRVGALLLLVVPDRDFTFDFRRRRTSWRHLEREHRQGVTIVDDDHVLDHLRLATGGGVPSDPEERRLRIEDARRSSIHAHVWDQSSFDDFIRRVLERHLSGVRAVERVPSVEAGGAMVYLLRRDAEEEGAAGA